MRRKVGLLAVFLATIASVLFVIRAAEPVKLTFWHMETMEPRKGTLEDMVGRFNQSHPGIQITAVPVDPSVYGQKIQTAMAGNAEPDIFMFWGGGNLKPYVDAGKMAPLTEYLTRDAKWRQGFVPGATDAYTFNKHIYGVPGEFHSIIMYYNKQIFKANRLDIPRNTTQLFETIKVLKKNNCIPIAYAGKETWIGVYYFDYLAMRLGGPEPFQKILRGEAGFTQENYVKAGQMLIDLVDAGAFPPGFLGIDYMTAQTLFITGKAAMYLQGSWAIADFLDKTKIPEGFTESVGIMSFPTVPGGRGKGDALLGGAGMGYVMTNKCANKAAAAEFIKWMTSAPQAAFKTERVGFLSGVNVKLDRNKVPQLLMDFAEMVNAASEVAPYYDTAFSSEVSNAHIDAVAKLFSKTATPEEAMKGLDQVLRKK